jgi:hypothetical protein
MSSHNSAQSIADILAATLVNQLVNGVRVMATQRKITLSRALETYISHLSDNPDAFLSLVGAFQRKFQEYNPRERQHPLPLFVRQIMSVYISREVITTMDDSAIHRVMRNAIVECLRALYALISQKGLDERIMNIQTSKPDDKKFVTHLVTETKRIALAELGNVQVRQSMVGGERLTIDTKQHQFKTICERLVYLYGEYKKSIAERDSLKAALGEAEDEIRALKGNQPVPKQTTVEKPILPDVAVVLPDRNELLRRDAERRSEQRRQAQEEEIRRQNQIRQEEEARALLAAPKSKPAPAPTNFSEDDDEIGDEDFGEEIGDGDDDDMF